jgi:hypothetical protein
MHAKVPQEPGRPERLLAEKPAKKGAPGPIPWPATVASHRSQERTRGAARYCGAKETKRSGTGVRESEHLNMTCEVGELAPEDPAEERGMPS